MTTISTDKLEAMIDTARSYIGANGYDPDPEEVIAALTELLTSRSTNEDLRRERDEAIDTLEKTRAVYENLEASEILNGYKNRAEAAERELAIVKRVRSHE